MNNIFKKTFIICISTLFIMLISSCSKPIQGVITDKQFIEEHIKTGMTVTTMVVGKTVISRPVPYSRTIPDEYIFIINSRKVVVSEEIYNQYEIGDYYDSTMGKE